MFLKRPQWEFAPHGKCGTQVSSLFPHMAECVDDLCVIRSMKSDHTNHYEATLGIHTGSFTFARPSIGSWVSYGLGTRESQSAVVRRDRAAIALRRRAGVGERFSARARTKGRSSSPAPSRWRTSSAAPQPAACRSSNSA